MLRSAVLLLAVAVGSSIADTDPFKKYTISADGINASFIGYGARLTNLFVNDKDGKAQDIVLGYDDGHQYLEDTLTNHTYFGPIVGRYANRIKNGTFSINGVTSHIPENEHGGLDTLHGGNVGYDQRNFSVVSYNTSTITFQFLDQGLEGFPGSVITYATYTVSCESSGPRWTSRLVSMALDEPTPIMLANHVYWNLDAFSTGPGKNILNNTLSIPYGDRAIVIDSLEIPTGELQIVKGTGLDFTSPKQLGQDILTTKLCGANCTGIDNAFILDRPRYSAPEANDLVVLSMSSPATGIQMDIRTNQQSMQVYSCVGQNGTIPVKASQQHGGDTKTYVEKYGCIVFETQQWIDGINHPEWGQSEYQIYGPDTEPAVSYTTYDFSVTS